MSVIHLKDEEPTHFLVDSKGDIYQVSKEIADAYALVRPRMSATIDHIDTATNTIWFGTPLPSEVKVDA